MRAETPLSCQHRAGTGEVWASPCPYEPLPCPSRPPTGMFNGSGGVNKSERKKWWPMEVIMSMSGVLMEMSGCENNVECNWQYNWIKQTFRVSERDENGGGMNVMKKPNAVKTELYEHEERRIQWRWRCLHVTLKAIILFVVQPAGSAPLSYGSAQTGNVSTSVTCVTG